MRRAFNIDIETCSECGGAVKVAAPAHPCARGSNASMHVIASIEDPVVIKKMLTHLNRMIPAPDLLVYRKVEPRRKQVGLRKPIVQTIGCNDQSGTVFFAWRTRIGLK